MFSEAWGASGVEVSAGIAVAGDTAAGGELLCDSDVVVRSADRGAD
jgi:hypothetical protein